MRNFLKILAIAMLAFVLVAFTTLAYVFSFYGHASTGTHDCAVVFGAAVWPGGNPSHALSDRTHEAIDLYEERRVSCLVLSGADSAYGKHEVDVMLDIAYERKVDLEDLELDYMGRNTKETIQNLDSGRSYVLVSNDFHLARIHLLATQRGLDDFDVHRSVYRQGRYTREPFFVLREVVAFWYYVFDRVGRST